MNSHENTKWVQSALRYVERGSACQNDFRMFLNTNMLRQLGQPEGLRLSVRQVVEETIARLGCQPQYNPRLLDLEWLAPLEEN